MITYKDLGRAGRFGNCLFQIAGTIGVAIKSGQPYGFPKFIIHDTIERFGSTEDPGVCKYLVNPLPEYDTSAHYQQLGYFWEYRDLILPTGNYDLSPSHFQSVKYFQHCIDKVRHYFAFKDEYPQNDYVAIHYRAGDYEDNQNAYHPRCSRDYYWKAMQIFGDNTEYVLFSDDPKEFIDKNKTALHDVKIHVWDKQNYIEDFKRMKSCKSFICANSSFSHMAALLGTHPEKKIIMPRHWFGAAANGLSFDTLYPSEAIII